MNINQVIKEVAKYKPHKNQLRYDNMMEKQYEFLTKVIKELAYDNVLDIGCAYGTMTLWFKKNGYKIDALDVTDEYSSKKMFEKEDIKFYKKNIETDQIDKKYKLIMFTEVLEHLNYNPLPVMKKLHDSLEKRGAIIMSTPARELDPPREQGRWTHYVNWRQIPEYKKYRFIDGHHHYYYIWELVDLIDEAGLIIAGTWRTKIGWTFILKRKKDYDSRRN
jgi:SAM-dependent methyltransferase